jgi:hypothetical protein
MRTLNLIGSKRTIGPMLREALVEHFGPLGGVTLVDAFFGSGGFTLAVHDLFGDLRLNDLELFSYAVAHALFVQPLDMSGVGPPIEGGYVERTYSGERGFFSADNARAADAFRAWARVQPPGPARWSSVGAFLSAMDRRANTASVYGAYLKRPMPKSLVPVELTPLYVGHAGGTVTITRGDAVDASMAAPPDSLLYLVRPARSARPSCAYRRAQDPPYVQRSYAANYFVLNVLADVDAEPEVRGKTGIPAAGYNKSAWNNAGRALDELRKILKGTPATRVALSYSTDGLMATGDIVAAFEAGGWDVSVNSVQQRRFKSHVVGEQNEDELSELLFLATRGAARAGA